MWTQTGTTMRRYPGVATAGKGLRSTPRERAPLREVPVPRAARWPPHGAPRPRLEGAPPGPLELAGGVGVVAAPFLLWAAFLLAV